MNHCQYEKGKKQKSSKLLDNLLKGINIKEIHMSQLNCKALNKLEAK